MKRGIEHGIPLSTQSIKLLKTLQATSKRESEFLFTSRDSVNKSISTSHLMLH